MTGDASAAAALLAAALAVWPSRRCLVRARARRLVPVPAPEATRPAGPGRRWALAAAAGLATGLLVGGPAGAVVAAGAAAVVERLLRRSADDSGRTAAELEAELPVACDLLAVCLGAGLPVGGALDSVAAAMPGRLGAELARIAGLYRLGSAPRRAWTEVPAQLAGLGRVVVRAGESGSTVVPALRALAADSRAAARSRTEVRVRRAGVWVLAPLGACFLPAFVCLGVAPVVLGIAANIFG